MFLADTHLFVTRVINTTDKKYCHRGLPRFPTIPPMSYIDIPGLYVKTKNDPHYFSAMDSGIRYITYSLLPTATVESLDNLPVIPQSELPVVMTKLRHFSFSETPPPEMVEAYSKTGDDTPAAANDVAEQGVKRDHMRQAIQAAPLGPDGQPLPSGVAIATDVIDRMNDSIVFNDPNSRRTADRLAAMKDQMVEMQGNPVHRPDIEDERNQQIVEAMVNQPATPAAAHPTPPPADLPKIPFFRGKDAKPGDAPATPPKSDKPKRNWKLF